MKIPLRFQTTEYDCGPASLINAFTYLFEREELPVSLLKSIYKYTLDVKSKDGIIGEGGTSRTAIKKFFHWLRKYPNKHNLNITSEILEQTAVTENKIRKCLSTNGCVLARCYQVSEHYVLITKIDNDCAYIFDPYYLDKDYYHHDPQVTIIFNQSYPYNRIVKLTRLFDQSHQDFSLMEIAYRQVVLINRRK